MEQGASPAEPSLLCQAAHQPLPALWAAVQPPMATLTSWNASGQWYYHCKYWYEERKKKKKTVSYRKLHSSAVTVVQNYSVIYIVQYKIPSTRGVFSCTGHMKPSPAIPNSSEGKTEIQMQSIFHQEKCFCLFSNKHNHSHYHGHSPARPLSPYICRRAHLPCLSHIPMSTSNPYVWSSDRPKPFPEMSPLANTHVITTACRYVRWLVARPWSVYRDTAHL